MRVDFSNKVAIVTGGGSGIGRAICVELGECGAKVVCVDMNEDRGRETVAALHEKDRDALYLQGDVTDASSVKNYVDDTVAAYGRIDIFANNAGYEGVVTPLTEYPEDIFDQVLAVNVKGVFLGLKYVLPIMVQQGSGVVTNTGSTASHAGATGVSAYTASKHAVLGLTRTAALEVAKFGVRVNAVCPGGTRTRMLDSLLSARGESEDLEFVIPTPNGRVAEPEEIAAVVAFLASDHARHIVGQFLVIDGGRLAM